MIATWIGGPPAQHGARLKTAPRPTAPQRGDVALSPIASAAPDPTEGAAGRMNFQSPFQPIQEENTLPYRSALGTEEQIREEIRQEKRATTEFLARYGISPTGGEERLARDINRMVENFERQQKDLIKRMEEQTALKIHDLLSAHPSWTAARDLPGQRPTVGGVAGGGGGPGDNDPEEVIRVDGTKIRIGPINPLEDGNLQEEQGAGVDHPEVDHPTKIPPILRTRLLQNPKTGRRRRKRRRRRRRRTRVTT